MYRQNHLRRSHHLQVSVQHISKLVARETVGLSYMKERHVGSLLVDVTFVVFAYGINASLLCNSSIQHQVSSPVTRETVDLETPYLMELHVGFLPNDVIQFSFPLTLFCCSHTQLWRHCVWIIVGNVEARRDAPTNSRALASVVLRCLLQQCLACQRGGATPFETCHIFHAVCWKLGRKLYLGYWKRSQFLCWNLILIKVWERSVMI